MKTGKETERKATDYEDMLDMPHHVSRKHPPMSMHDRAAQFSPFAALTGFDAAIDEAARLTDQRIDLEENQKEHLDQMLSMVENQYRERKSVMLRICYFQEDSRKEGGTYRAISGNMKKLDKDRQELILNDDTRIRISDIYEIEIQKR